MLLYFSKYHGTGNDFVLIDDRESSCGITKNDTDIIARLCDRRFGIGADGLMLLRDHAEYDFEMVYFNADGQESSMCGNGGRCIVAFAKKVDVFSGTHCSFWAIDGLHEATILPDGLVSLGMKNVAFSEIQSVGDNSYTVNTGSPHYVRMVNDLAEVNIVQMGRSIRNSDTYKAEGINVNFSELTDEGLNVLTYERGVEDETYSCGTGVVACTLVNASLSGNFQGIDIKTKGGKLRVTFDTVDDVYQNIQLIGPAVHVYSGVMEWRAATL